jgi:hypothetical protein
MSDHSAEIRKLSSLAAERLFCIPQDLQLGTCYALSTLERALEEISTALDLARAQFAAEPDQRLTRPERADVAAAGLCAVEAALFGAHEMAVAAE